MTEYIFIIAGYLAGFLLFFKKNKLEIEKFGTKPSSDTRVSIIIPARNEERNIPVLLADLMNQTIKIDEIICADDESSDKTAIIAKTFGVVVISVPPKPQNWVGKSWACQSGAREATGDVLIFVDADVRLSPNAIKKLLSTYHNENSVLSVQPYHIVRKFYEQVSFFFNATLIAANGVGVPFKSKKAGLFGPVILISREIYNAIGGHDYVKASVVEDLMLSEILDEMNIPVKLFWGDADISFQMYNNSMRDLFQGWSKNFASGAVRTPILIIALLTLWFYSSTAVAINLCLSIVSFDLSATGTYVVLYLAWVIEYIIIARMIGNFKKYLLLFYPVLSVAFFAIFGISIFKKVFRIKTIWKDRKIIIK